MSTYPNAASKPVLSHGLKMKAHLGLILHVQAGNGGLQREFSNPLNGKSSTWWVGRGGAVEQYVDSDYRAWAHGAGNSTYNSVETEGFPADQLTPEQIKGLADLYRWGHDTYGWPYILSERPGDPGFGWHGMGGADWGGHPGCPGVLRRSQRQEILDQAQRSQMPAPPAAGPTEDDMIQYEWDDGAIVCVDAAGHAYCPSYPGRPTARHYKGIPDLRDDAKRAFDGRVVSVVGVSKTDSQAGYVMLDSSWGANGEEYKFDPSVAPFLK